MFGENKQKLNSVLITPENIKAFIRDQFSIDDPVLCVWCTKEPPESQPTHEQEVYQLDNAVLFVKEDVESMLFPEGFSNPEWNLVLICLKQKTTPLLGWLMGKVQDCVLEETWFKGLKLNL